MFCLTVKPLLMIPAETLRYALTALSLAVVASAPLAVAQDLPATTPLDEYIQKPDPSYRWKVIKEAEQDGLKTLVVDMTSQTWRSSDDVNRTEWQHWMTFAIPENAQGNMAFLFISGGSNGGEPPEGPSDLVRMLAKLSGGIVVELKMVPNQSLIFKNDGRKRVEDDLIGYTWKKFLETNDASWLARPAMVKSAVRAMDTITAVMKSETGGGRQVDRFVVAGGSKRGWTTWLTGAVDSRVVAIVPIVIDVLNVRPSMEHHFAAYGFWAPALGDYAEHRIVEHLDDVRLDTLYRIEDPYYYRHRLKLPKYIVNAAGDQFFLPDSSQFYWDDLEGEKYLRYVPNTDHGLDGSDALASISAFYRLMLSGQRPPQFTWKVDNDGAFRVTPQDKPAQVLLWQATNPQRRDFRVETFGKKYTSTPLEPESNGEYVGRVAEPEKGWTAYFVELTYDIGGPVPLKMTTNIRITPDTLPHREKMTDLPPSLTVICTAADPDKAASAQEAIKQVFAGRGVDIGQVKMERDGVVCYFNWEPHETFEDDAKAVIGWLQSQGLDDFEVQLESGREITRPDAPQP